jgi:hypothetical protein
MTTTPARWAPAFPALATVEPPLAPATAIARRLGLLRRRHGLEGPTSRAVAALASGEGRP